MHIGVLIKLGRGACLPVLAIAAGSIGLTACTIEMGPPPESDPPLVTESQRPPPPPPQPTEPQAWSKDLDFDTGGELRVRRQEMAEGLVGADGDRPYSGERLTFESAESSERPPSEAELIRERARQRLLEAQSVSAEPTATMPPVVAPPEVVAAPVESVSAESLPDLSQSGGGSEEPLTTAAAPTEASDQAATPPEAGTGQDKPQDTQTAGTGSVVAGETAPPDQAAAERPRAVEEPAAANLAPAEKLTGSADTADAPQTEQVAALSLEPWDAPEGTILVQVSAIQDRQQIAQEWERLKQGYPTVFAPLRLVVDEAKLGDRGVFFRVQAGGFANAKQAEEACSTLTGQGQSCFVVQRSAGG